MMRRPRAHPLSWVALAVALGTYLAIGLYHLDLPGFHYDEAFDALPALEMVLGSKPSAAMNVTFLGRELPLMLHPHIGPTSTYLCLLAFAIAGVSVQAVRAAHLAVGALTIVLLWSIARRWFDEVVAAAAVVLCATAPAFVWWNRAGANWSATLLPLALGVVLTLCRWFSTRSVLALMAAAFLFGAGVATKINFVWLGAPITLTAFAVLGVRAMVRVLRSVTWGARTAAIGAFLCGAAPLLIYNIRTAGGTLQFVARNTLHTEYGQNNIAFLDNLSFLVRDFTTVMGGSTGEFPSPSGGTLAGAVFIASTIYLSVRSLQWCRQRASQKSAAPAEGSPSDTAVASSVSKPATLFLVLSVATLLPLGTVTTSRVGARHLFMLVPFAWLIVAAATVDAGRVVRQSFQRRGRMALAAAALPYALIALVLLGHLRDQLGIHRFVTATGGYGVWSDAISTLAERLETTYADRTPVAMDWGLMRNVSFLTATRVTPREAFEYQPHPSAAFEEVATGLVRDPRNLYVFHAPGFTVFHGYREALEAAAIASGQQMRLVETLTQRDGTANVLLYSVRGSR